MDEYKNVNISPTSSSEIPRRSEILVEKVDFLKSHFMIQNQSNLIPATSQSSNSPTASNNLFMPQNGIPDPSTNVVKAKKRFTSKKNHSEEPLSNQCISPIKKPYKGNNVSNRTLNIRQSFSDNTSTEAVVSENESDTTAKPRKKQKRHKKRIQSHQSILINEQINSPVEWPLKSLLVSSENDSSNETSSTAPIPSKYVEKNVSKKCKRKPEMKGNSMDLANKTSVKSQRPSDVEESDSSIQKPSRKKVKVLDSEASDDIPFSLKERSSQSEIFLRNGDQNSNIKNRKNITSKRKLSGHKNGGVSFNTDSDILNNNSIMLKRKLRSHKNGKVNDSNLDTQNNKSNVRERKLDGHKLSDTNSSQNSNSKHKRNIMTRARLRSLSSRKFNEKENLEEKSISKSNKKINQRLAINQNRFTKINDHAEFEEQTTSKPVQLPGLCDEESLETFSNEQELSKENTLDVKEISIERSTFLEENLPDCENITETSEKCLENSEVDGDSEPIVALSAYPKEDSQKDICIEKTNLGNIPSKKSSVLLKNFMCPLEVENKDLHCSVNTHSTHDNPLDILPCEENVHSLEEKNEFPASSALTIIQETEQEAKIEQNSTRAIADAVTSTNENFEDDFGFASDDTFDINSDYISPESIYDDSDCDPDWFMNETCKKSLELSIKKNQREISCNEDSDCNDVHNISKRSRHSSSKESAKILKVKFNSSKKKRSNRLENKEVSLLESHISSAIEEDLSRKNETINKWEKLFWGIGIDSVSSSELMVNEDKQLAENIDLNDSLKTVITEDQVCNLKIEDTFSIAADSCAKEEKITKDKESDCSLKITKSDATQISKGNVQKKFESESSDIDFDSELIVNEINCDDLILPKHLIINNHQKTLSVEDRIFGSDSSLNNGDTETMEWKNYEDKSTSHDKTVLKNSDSTDDFDFDPELLDEINCDELLLPERLIMNKPKANEKVENRIVSSNDTVKDAEKCENLTVEEDDPICYGKNMHESYHEQESTCVNNNQVIIEAKNPTMSEQIIDKIDGDCSDHYSDIAEGLIVNGLGCGKLHLTENESEKSISIQDKIIGSISSLKDTVTEKCNQVIIEAENLTVDETITHKVDKSISDNNDSNIMEGLRKELNCEESLHLPESSYQKNISVEDIILEFTTENEVLSFKENDALVKTESGLSQKQPSSNDMENIGNTPSETCESISPISVKEEFSFKTVSNNGKNYNFSNSISKQTGLVVGEAFDDEMQDLLECDVLNFLPFDNKGCDIKKKNISEEEYLVLEKELQVSDEQKSGDVQYSEDIITKENKSFVENQNTMPIYSKMVIINAENYNTDNDNNSDYAAELVSELSKTKNSECSRTYESSQNQICENESSQMEFLEDGPGYSNKSNEDLLQDNLWNGITPNVSINSNKVSSLSKLSRDAVEKTNKNELYTETETLNSSKMEIETNTDKRKPSCQMPTNQKTCVVSDERFVTAKHKGNLTISLPETSETGVSKTNGRHSKTFHKHKNSYRNFKDKKPMKRKTHNKYLKYRTVKVDSENPIKSILQVIDVKENVCTQLKPHTSSFITSVYFNHCVKSLVNYLLHPDKTPDITVLIFFIIKYLHYVRQNPLENFSENQDRVSIPVAENCIVTALFEIEEKSKPGFQELIETILNVIYQFILAKNKIHIYGLASICRVFTEICKRRNDKLKPLHLCCDLLKEKHKFASLLIVSVAKVWKELFWISKNLLEEENALQISLAYGIIKSVESSAIVAMYCSLKVISEYFDVSKNVSDINEIIQVLKNQILEKSTQNSLKNSWKLTLPLVIFTSFETWESAKKNLLCDYIIPYLQYFTNHEANEEAFDLFCNLYVDVLLLFPEHNPDELMHFVQASPTSKGVNFIQDCAAVALIKYYILSKRDVPLFLTTWKEKNQTKPKVKALKVLYQRKLMSDNEASFSKDEIILTPR